MANFGRPNTNNSQFCICAVDFAHLDGTNVVFGKVIKGFSIVGEMEKLASDDAQPLTVSAKRIFVFSPFTYCFAIEISGYGDLRLWRADIS